jgi:hypothetical protein
MAIRLSLDLSGITCGELLRFADTVRAAGTPPEQSVERVGADRIEVSVTGTVPRPATGPGQPGPHSYGQVYYGSESYGPESYGYAYGPESYGSPGPADRPPGRPGHGGPGGRSGFTRPAGPAGPPGARPGRSFGPPLGPQPGMPPAGMPYFGEPVEVPWHNEVHGPPMQGAYLCVRQGDREFATDVSTETVEKWKVALSEALEATGLRESARGPLLELRALLSLEGFPRRDR